jgi:hypothetical protein
MPVAGGDFPPTPETKLLLIPDALLADGPADGYALHPALRFAAPRLSRAAKMWTETAPLAPIEWYAALIGAAGGAASLLAAAMGDAVPADARQAWLFSPFAGRLGRDSVHIMPEDMFAWDGVDAAWLVETLQPMLAGDGITLRVRDACMLAVSDLPWDASPVSFARLAGHVLPNRHPEGADGGRLMRLCAEMQMLLASRPSLRRRQAGLPDVMGVWLWAPSALSARPVRRPALIAGDALIRACSDDAGGMLPVAIVGAAGVEAHLEHQRFPRHWLLGGGRHAVLADMRALPRFGRRPWQPRNATACDALLRRMHRVAGISGGEG